MKEKIINTFVFEGSLNVNSKSNELVKRLLNAMGKKNKLHINTVSVGKMKIKNCIGCQTCFTKGYCILKDDMEQIKKDLLDSDLIIFSTPVYLKQVSASTKLFLDRLGYWTHLMRLLGKKAIIIVTGSTNGINETAKYMLEICRYLGLCDIDLITYNEMTDGEICSSFEIVQTIADKTIKYYNTNEKLIISRKSEKIFESYKSLYSNMKNNGIETYEIDYWERTGLLNSESLQDFINRKNNYNTID